MVAVMLIIFLVPLILGVPITFSLGLSSLFYLFANGIPLTVIAQKFYTGMDSSILPYIPGFMLVGALMNGGGITRRILNFCNSFLGHFHGSLALVSIVVSMVLAGVSGTTIIDMCGLGSMLIPAMVEDGYDDGFSVVVTAAPSVVGPIIPPSVPMVMVDSCVGTSAGKIFRVGTIPGILLGLVFCVLTYTISVKHDYPRHERADWKVHIQTTKDAVWTMLMPVILLGGTLSGVFTPTEVLIVTYVYALIVRVFVYKEIKTADMPRIAWGNIRARASTIVLIGLVNVFAYILTVERIPQMMVNSILNITDGRIVVILLINVMLLSVGMFTESLAVILITFLVLLPMATAVGMDPIHFALIAILNLMLGLTVPPVGMCVCIGTQIGKISVFKAFRATTPLLATSLLVLMLIPFVPQLTLWIPSVLN